MDITEAIKMRKSVRGYKPDPIPKEVIKEILGCSIQAPSAMNTQPWLMNVVTGNTLDEIKRRVMEAVNLARELVMENSRLQLMRVKAESIKAAQSLQTVEAMSAGQVPPGAQPPGQGQPPAEAGA